MNLGLFSSGATRQAWLAGPYDNGADIVAGIPIIAHHTARPQARRVRQAESLAAALVRAQPDLTVSESFRPLVPESIEDAPSLHLDDLSTIVRLERFYDVSFLEDRARLRATDGEYVASCASPCPAFAAYCDNRLALSPVTWLHPQPRENALQVAAACWADREVRRTFVHAFRAGALRYLHPHMGNFPVWATAALLQRASRRPVSVIAPHPNLTKRVNDKLWFSAVAKRLFGTQSTPRTAAAHSSSAVAYLLRQLAPLSRHVVVKLPTSAGGAGNVVIRSKQLRGRSLGNLRTDVKRLLADLGWTGEGPLLVGSWETDVFCAPSVQLWIPPESQGTPVVEGVFEQLLEGPERYFMGSRAATLPSDITQELVDQCWLMARLFQRLRYVGRCSFDLLLVGERLADCRVEFVECNGRWGGTSLPMSLMNRLFGDWAAQPYATNACIVPGLERVTFETLLEYFAGDLYDARTGRGSLIFYNPGGLPNRHGIDVLAIADSWEAASQLARVDIPRRLRELIRGLGIRASRWGQIR